MIKSLIRKAADCIAPGATERFSEGRWLKQHAVEFKAGLKRARSFEERVSFARSHSHLRSNQKHSEILPLLELLASLKPRAMCEIGADKGGTLALFASVAAADARILSIDISYPASRMAACRSLPDAGQRLTCMEADSHLPSTLQAVKRWLNGGLLDFLFIDGDHSHRGVESDYEMFSPLVRAGGVIAFHDIVPDFRTRFGTNTSVDVGEVPAYWTSLKAKLENWDEFIEDDAQDGYGIGVTRVPDSASS